MKNLIQMYPELADLSFLTDEVAFKGRPLSQQSADETTAELLIAVRERCRRCTMKFDVDCRGIVSVPDVVVSREQNRLVYALEQCPRHLKRQNQSILERAYADSGLPEKYCTCPEKLWGNLTLPQALVLPSSWDGPLCEAAYLLTQHLIASRSVWGQYIYAPNFARQGYDWTHGNLDVRDERYWGQFLVIDAYDGFDIPDWAVRNIVSLVGQCLVMEKSIYIVCADEPDEKLARIPMEIGVIKRLQDLQVLNLPKEEE